MKMKSYRYGHEQNCEGNLENKPVKKIQTPDQNKHPNLKSKNHHQKYFAAMKRRRRSSNTQPFIKTS